MKTVKVKILRDKTTIFPEYAHDGDSGVDVLANNEVPIKLKPGEIRIIPTGLKVSIPKGYEIQVRSRSGLAANHGILVLNSPGTIDSTYRGEIKVILYNAHSTKGFRVDRGDKIAQLVLCEVPKIKWQEVKTEKELEKTSRGSKGFGSSGVKTKETKTKKVEDEKVEKKKEEEK